MTKVLSGKAALVTGGSQGIGATAALALAELGADVAISFATSAEVPDGGGVHVDASQASEAGFESADAGNGLVEPTRAPSEAAEQVGVFGRPVIRGPGLHSMGPLCQPVPGRQRLLRGKRGRSVRGVPSRSGDG